MPVSISPHAVICGENDEWVLWLEPVRFTLRAHVGRPRPTDFDLEPGYSTEEMVSPSQADLFIEQCKRKWGFKYVEKRDTPQTAGQVLGTEFHAQLERWLLHGTPPTHRRMLKSGVLSHFPPPQAEHLRAEQAFVFALNWAPARPGVGEAGRVLLWGFKDAEQITPDGWHVYDLKSTIDLAAWSKLAGKAAVVQPDRDLRKDTQALTYALGGFAEAIGLWGNDVTFNPSDLQVFLHWVYVQTQNASISSVTSDVPGQAGVAFGYEATMKAMARKVPGLIELVSKRIEKSKKTLTVLSMPATPTACGAYGGCPYRADCRDVPPVAVVTSLFAQKRAAALRAKAFSTPETTQENTQMTTATATVSANTIVERSRALAAQKAAAGGSAPPPPPAVKPAAAAAPAAPAAGPAAGVPASMKSALAKLTKPAGAPAAAAAVAKPAAAAPVVKPLPKPAAVVAKPAAAAAAAVVKPPPPKPLPKPLPKPVVTSVAPLPEKVELEAAGSVWEAEIFQGPSKKWAGTVSALSIYFDQGETREGLLSVLAALVAQKALAMEEAVLEEAGAVAAALAEEAAVVDAALAEEAARLAEVVEAQAAPEAPKRRGRPPKAAAAAPAAAAPTGFVLYLDVLPYKGAPLQDVEELVGPVRQAVEVALKMNYRLEEFGKGARLLSAQLQDEFALSPPVGMYQASSKTLDKEVLDVLIRQADQVFKGVW